MTYTRGYLVTRAAAPAPLIEDGRINRRELMRKACKLARTVFRHSATWGRRMALGLKAAWSDAKADLALFLADRADRARRMAGRPFKTETALMARLTKAQNLPHNASRDVMTWAAMCTTRSELEAHVVSSEAAPRQAVYRRPLAVSGARIFSHSW